MFAEPGAMTAALNWYRAMDGDLGEVGGRPEVTVPVLFMWGNRDIAVGRAGVEAQRELMPEDFTEVELDASHWLMERAPERVVREVVGFVAGR